MSRAKPSRDPDLLAIYEFTTLVSASARSARQHERIVRAVDASITGAGLVALRVVERHGPIAMSEVARRLQIDQSTASRHVRPLEERGLLTRTADAADRRVAWLRVTATGQRLLDGARDVVLHDFDVALGDWSHRRSPPARRPPRSAPPRPPDGRGRRVGLVGGGPEGQDRQSMTADDAIEIGLPQTSTRDAEATRAALEHWLAAVLPEGGEPKIVGLDAPSTNGMSSETVLFDATWRDGSTRVEHALVARIAPDPVNVPVFPDVRPRASGDDDAGGPGAMSRRPGATGPLERGGSRRARLAVLRHGAGRRHRAARHPPVQLHELAHGGLAGGTPAPPGLDGGGAREPALDRAPRRVLELPPRAGRCPLGAGPPCRRAA